MALVTFAECDMVNRRVGGQRGCDSVVRCCRFGMAVVARWGIAASASDKNEIMITYSRFSPVLPENEYGVFQNHE